MAKITRAKEDNWKPHTQLVLSAREHDALRNALKLVINQGGIVLSQNHFEDIRAIHDGLLHFDE